MRASRFAFLLMVLTAVPLFARSTPTITSITPSSIYASSGEWFATINGSHFLPFTGVSVIYTGPAGTFSVPPSAGTDSNIIVWVPLEAMISPGNYTVTVRAIDGRTILDSNPVTLRIIGSSVCLTLPPIVLAEATSLLGSYANFDVVATTELGDKTYLDCSHKSGELFPFGTTEVDCTATDDFGGAARGSFNVQVADTTPPVIKAPTDLTAFGNADGASVKYDVAASDAVDSEATVTCTPGSGSFFRVGTSSVNCTSVDRFKNQSNATFRVHVGDDEIPALIVPLTVQAEAASLDGAAVSYNVSAVDAKGSQVGVECDPKSGSQFIFGTTTVKCVATGPSGLSASEIFNVNVVDTTAPQLAIPRDFTQQAPAPEGATITYDAYGKDAVDGQTVADCYPASGSLFPSGQTTVNCTTSDKSRNVSTGSFVVTVLPWVDSTDYSRYDDTTPEL